ncbi:MAG TPA: hypothetical protein DDW30_03130 [Clostridiales bacterium]|nr:hypothetical protein [Clostridiales bacterium]
MIQTERKSLTERGDSRSGKTEKKGMKYAEMRKTFISTVALLMAILMLCTACTGKTEGTEGTSGAETTGENGPPPDAMDLTDFKILCAEDADDTVKSLTIRLRNGLEDMCGIKLETDTDFVRRGEAVPTDTKEILVGNTNRRTATDLKKMDLQIIREGNRIYLLGGSEPAVGQAVTYFLENYIVRGYVSIADPTVCLREGTYPAEKLLFGATEVGTVKIFYSLTNAEHQSLWQGLEDSLLDATGKRAEVVNSAAEANLIFEEKNREAIGEKDWGTVCEDGKLTLIGGSTLQSRKVIAHFREKILLADGTCTFEKGVYSMDMMTKEEYYRQDRLEIYPEFPEQVRRDYSYSVTVTQGDKTAKIPVYNHEMNSAVSRNPNCGIDGHRRFSTFAFSGEQVRVDIEVKRDFEFYSLMPSAKNFRHEYKNGVISVWLEKPEYFMIRLDDKDESILSVFADYPEFPDDVDLDDPNTIRVEGWYEVEGGVLELTEPGKTVYIAPGAVLHARIDVKASYTRIIGRGAIVDPFENFAKYSRDIINDKKGGLMIYIWPDANDAQIDGIFLLDAQCFNIATRGKRGDIRNTKVLSTIISTDGISAFIGSSGTLVEHCFIYCGDNTMVFSSGITYRDMLVGTTCAAIYPQDDVYDVLLEDIHVFRADDAIIDNIYNAGQKHTKIDMTINNIDTVDCTYAPRIIRCQNMGGNPKNFTIRNLSVGAYGLMQTQNGILVENMDGYLDTYNYTFNLVNYAIDGATVSKASSIGLRFDEDRNTCNYSTEAGFTPVKREDYYADYTMPSKVYIGALQLMFNNPVVKQSNELLLPYEEIRTLLRTEKTATTVDVGGVAYVKASVLASAGLCKSAAMKNGNLYLTPQYNGENLLLADSGEISHYARATGGQQLCSKVENGTVIYRTDNVVYKQWAGVRRYIGDETAMYGAGTYTLTFRVRADSARTNALRVKTTLKNNDRFTYKNVSVTKDWTVFVYTFELTAEQITDPLMMFDINTLDKSVVWFEVCGLTLVKVK